MISRWIIGFGLVAVSVYALGLAACSDDSSNPGVAGAGGTPGGGGQVAGGAGGMVPAGGTAGSGVAGSGVAGSGTGGGGGPTPFALPLDDTGWVQRDTNDWGIQGAYYWYADFSEGNPGLTQLTNVTEGAPPWDATRQGMCLVGTTPGGQADNWVTWGAGIGLNLNQEEGGTTAPPLVGSGLTGFDITIDGTWPEQLLVKFLPENPMPGTDEAPSVALAAGVNHVDIASAVTPSWAPNAGDVGDPNSLAAIQIQANSGTTGGTIDFCITAIAPY